MGLDECGSRGVSGSLAQANYSMSMRASEVTVISACKLYHVNACE